MTILAMTKIVVSDLPRLEAFYREVCGFDQVQHIKGEGFAEAIMRPSGDQTGAALVLFADGSKPTPGEAVLVFETDHVPAFSERILANGGVVTHPAQTVDALGLTFAMYKDPEGHVIEAIARQPI
ncbi:MAG: VOC family protein [Novosphingobium sp.]